MKRLRREAERVVAPLQASPWRKNRMREELLAHLTALYEEESTRHADSSQALAATLARFGSPDELTRNLQASVPMAERWLWYQFPGHRWKNRQPGETAVRHILRTATYATAYITVSNFLLIGVVAAIGRFAARRPLPARPSLVSIACLLAIVSVLMLVWTVVMPLCCELMHRQTAYWRTTTGRQRRQAAGLVAAGLLLATGLGTATIATFMASFEWLLGIPLVTGPQFALVVVVGSAIVLLLVVIQAWQQAQAARQFDDYYAEDGQLAD